MKILFAVNNESISESIIKKYQQDYKEIISSKNVYYFDAITRELQKDKTYDRIIISEDVEPFANNNYSVIDRFIFDRLDNISDEATSANGQDIPIILICTDRRSKSENFLVRIFGIGIYSALLGQDRTISNVCQLINKPRSKKEAKIYYRIDTEDVEYKSENEEDVNEEEIQNILNHYKRLGKNEEEYVRSFDNIAEQYTDAQLRIICRFLPLNVKAVLEANSPKYQEIVTFSTPVASMPKNSKNKTSKFKLGKDKNVNKGYQKNNDIIEKNIGKSELTKPVIIPSVLGSNNSNKEQSRQDNKNNQPIMNINVNKDIEKANNSVNNQPLNVNELNQKQDEQEDILAVNNNTKMSHDEIDSILNSVENEIKEQKTEEVLEDNTIQEPQKKKRGRPRKIDTNVEEVEEKPKKKRGRPRKVDTSNEVVQKDEIQQDESVNLFELDNDSQASNNNGGIVLPGLEDDNIENDSNMNKETENNSNIEEYNNSAPNLFDFSNDDSEQNDNNIQTQNNTFNNNDMFNNPYNSPFETQQFNSYTPNIETMQNNQYSNASREVEKTNQYQDMDLKNNLISMSNKLVAFVGTSKNGTSFLVNNMAEILSNKGIKTAILDLTQNKNAYYIYTQNDENLRKISYNCIAGLKNGEAKGIEVNKNLTVYTTIPERNDEFSDYRSIITTLMKNYSLVLMDCDYETKYEYFDLAQEIYLVQSYDILTIQPLTAFLRNLKSRNILDPQKLRVVLNKVLRVRSITDRVIIGGMSSYNDPSMSYMTELFDRDNIKCCSIPFEQETYSRYLDGLVNCEISTKGYSKNFMASLDKLANMIYPLLNNDKSANKYNTYSPNKFSNDMNQTLNKMKTRY